MSDSTKFEHWESVIIEEPMSGFNGYRGIVVGIESGGFIPVQIPELHNRIHYFTPSDLKHEIKHNYGQNDVKDQLPAELDTRVLINTAIAELHSALQLLKERRLTELQSKLRETANRVRSAGMSATYIE